MGVGGPAVARLDLPRPDHRALREGQVKLDHEDIAAIEQVVGRAMRKLEERAALGISAAVMVYFLLKWLWP